MPLVVRIDPPFLYQETVTVTPGTNSYFVEGTYDPIAYAVGAGVELDSGGFVALHSDWPEPTNRAGWNFSLTNSDSVDHDVVARLVMVR